MTYYDIPILAWILLLSGFVFSLILDSIIIKSKKIFLLSRYGILFLGIILYFFFMGLLRNPFYYSTLSGYSTMLIEFALLYYVQIKYKK